MLDFFLLYLALNPSQRNSLSTVASCTGRMVLENWTCEKSCFTSASTYLLGTIFTSIVVWHLLWFLLKYCVSLFSYLEYKGLVRRDLRDDGASSDLLFFVLSSHYRRRLSQYERELANVPSARREPDEGQRALYSWWPDISRELTLPILCSLIGVPCPAEDAVWLWNWRECLRMEFYRNKQLGS